MKNLIYLSLLVFASASLLTSCDKENHDNEEEVITNLNYVLTDTAGNTVAMSFEDLDGDGGNAPTITGGTLAANMTYTGALTLSNESETPAEDITVEIQEEDTDHQFFFASTVTGLSVAYADTDDNNNPVGLATTVTTGAAGTGTLTVTLLHEPDKSASGVATGDPSNAGGETDIELTFSVTVQ